MSCVRVYDSGVFDEIGRNGFGKIILYDAHGGNQFLSHFVAQCSLWEEKPYVLYRMEARLTPERLKKEQEIYETTLHAHAGEGESSVTMANCPGMVKTDRIPKEQVNPLKRMAHLPPTFCGISWYSNYPEHYAGDANYASEEKGMSIVQLRVDSLAEYIAAVKADEVAPTLQKGFFERVRRVGK